MQGYSRSPQWKKSTQNILTSEAVIHKLRRYKTFQAKQTLEELVTMRSALGSKLREVLEANQRRMTSITKQRESKTSPVREQRGFTTDNLKNYEKWQYHVIDYK